MNQEPIDIFNYDEEIGKIKEPWELDMAEVFREFDEDLDGKIDPKLAHHIFILFRLAWHNEFEGYDSVTLKDFLWEAARSRDQIFANPRKRYIYYFQMIAGINQSELDATDIQRFMLINEDEVPLKFCEDFIDEFDRKGLSSDVVSIEEFCKFCEEHKIPV